MGTDSHSMLLALYAAIKLNSDEAKQNETI